MGYSRRKWPKWYKIDREQPGELPGSLQAEYVRCGKAGCCCERGEREDLHGPYWYRRWRDEAGRQRKVYVKRSEVDAVQAAIARRNERLAVEREEREKHMGRGKYSWKAEHPEYVPPTPFEQMFRQMEQLRRLIRPQ